MIRYALSILTLLLLILPAGAIAAADKAGDIHARTRAIANELSCVVCQGQSLASSNAALARDMRAFIAAKLKDGKSAAEIKAFLRRRYGDKILMQPPMKPGTYLLWATPGIAFLAGLGVLIAFYRHRRRTS